MKNNKNLSFAVSLALCLSTSLSTQHAMAAASTGIIHYHNDQSVVDDDSDLVMAAQLLLGSQTSARQPVQLPQYVQASNRVPVQRQYRPSQQRQAFRVAPSPRRANNVVTRRPANTRSAFSRVTTRLISSARNVGRHVVHAPHEDMWHHVRAGYRMNSHMGRRDVQRFIRHYTSKPQRLQRIANRATKYLHLVVNELKNRNMPMELALLPFVESAYVNTARSHAGAAGIWQFIPSTGRIYGLRQNRTFDGRLDVVESTRAALDYLQKLHREFRGDWFLALAAYNAGEGRVGRAIKYNRARGRPTDYWSLRLPRETREYVPRLLAYRHIITQPQRYGFRLPRTPNTANLAEVRVNKPINLREAAAFAGLKWDTLVDLNPGYLRGVTTPRLSTRIVVPSNRAEQLAQIIGDLPAAKMSRGSKKSRRTYRSNRKRNSYRFHRVKRGETLFRIARKHRVSVSKLRRVNGIRGNRIRVGTRLKI